MKAARYEVHEHSCPRTGKRVSHSHEGGDVPHLHPAYGPATYAIDEEDWFRVTGRRGGGDKVFTKKPTGPLLPYEECEPPEFDIVVVGDGGAKAARGGQGPGIALPERLRQKFKMKIASIRSVP